MKADNGFQDNYSVVVASGTRVFLPIQEPLSTSKIASLAPTAEG